MPHTTTAQSESDTDEQHTPENTDLSDAETSREEEESTETTSENNRDQKPQEPTGSVARNSSVMAVGSTVSRITGFARTAVIGAVLSGGVLADSYQVANTLPNMVFELLLGGVLASVIVPILVKARKTDPDGGVAFTQRLLTVAIMLLLAATLLALLAAPLITGVIVSDSATGPEQRVVTWLAYLLLPQIFFYGISAMCGAILNTRGHFTAPAWAPIVNNVVVIATGGVFLALPGPALPTPSTITGTQLLVLGVGTTLGIAAQSLTLLPALRRVGFSFKWRWDFAEAHLGEAARLAAWMLFYVGVSQIGVFVVMSLGYRAAEDGGPGPFIYNNAHLLFMMVHGIVAVSVIMALVPRMSAAAVEENYAEVASHLSLGVRLTSVVLVGATAVYIALGIPLAITAFQWGHFSTADAHATGLAVITAGMGLIPFAISQLQIFAFYALRDTKTPALANIAVVVVKILVDVVLYFSLPAKYVVIGLTIGDSLSYCAAVVLFTWLLRKRIGRLGMNRILQTLTRLTLSALIAGSIGWGVSFGIISALGENKLSGALALSLGGATLATAYVAGAIFLRVQEVQEMRQMLLRKIRPGS